MIDYIAEMDHLRFHLLDEAQIEQHLKEGYSIYKIEDGKETLIASPKTESVPAPEQDSQEV